MKGIFKQSIILVIVAITVAACSTKQPANIMTLNNINNLKFLSHDELGDVEAVLNNTDTKHYDYRIVSIEGQKQGARKLLVKKKGGFNGLLFMYNKKHLNPLGGAFYSDQQGSLLRFADRDKAFAVTYMADGRKILAIDGNRDGAIETLVGNIGVDDFWIISDEIASLLPCLSSSGGHVYDAIFDCTRPQASGGSGGSGGANAGGGSSNTPDFGSDLLGEPDCSDQGPGGVVSNPPTPPGEDPAPPPPPPSTESPDDEGYPPMGRRETPSTSPEGRPGRTITIRTADTLIIQETGENPDGSIIRTTIHRDSQGRETFREDTLVGPAPDRRLLMHRVNHTTYDADGNPTSTVTTSRQARHRQSLEPVNPNGGTVFEDPRCAGRDTRNAQGLGFLDLCAAQGSVDFLDCYRQLENPLYNISGGRCTLASGPADGLILKCENNQSIAECFTGGGSAEECAQNGPNDDFIGTPGGPGAGPTDGPALPDNIGSSDIKYIDTIPLGAVLIGICSRGGCPDPRPF